MAMAPSPLAAAATECRIVGAPQINRREAGPGKPCSVRIHGELVVSYRLRRVGGVPSTTILLHDEAPRRFEQCFDLYDPDAFFGSYTACRDADAAPPRVRPRRRAADNWDEIVTPDMVAKLVVDGFRRDTERHGGVAVGVGLDLRWAQGAAPRVHPAAARPVLHVRVRPVHEGGARRRRGRVHGDDGGAACGVLCVHGGSGDSAQRLHREAAVLARLPPWLHPALVLQGGHLPDVPPRHGQVPRRRHRHPNGQVPRPTWTLTDTRFPGRSMEETQGGLEDQCAREAWCSRRISLLSPTPRPEGKFCRPQSRIMLNLI